MILQEKLKYDYRLSPFLRPTCRQKPSIKALFTSISMDLVSRIMAAKKAIPNIQQLQPIHNSSKSIWCTRQQIHRMYYLQRDGGLLFFVCKEKGILVDQAFDDEPFILCVAEGGQRVKLAGCPQNGGCEHNGQILGRHFVRRCVSRHTRQMRHQVLQRAEMCRLHLRKSAQQQTPSLRFDGGRVHLVQGERQGCAASLVGGRAATLVGGHGNGRGGDMFGWQRWSSTVCDTCVEDRVAIHRLSVPFTCQPGGSTASVHQGAQIGTSERRGHRAARRSGGRLEHDGG